MLERVEKLRLVDQAIDNFFVGSFPFESSKHPVPDYQDSSIIFVQAISVRSCSINFFYIKVF